MSALRAKAAVDVKAHKGVSRILGPIWWVGRGLWGDLPPLTGRDCNIYLIRGDKFDVLVDVGLTRPL